MENNSLSLRGKVMVKTSGASSVHDFDFLLGAHQVHHRKLKKRLAHCEEWVEFEGTHSLDKLLGGLGNLEQHRMALPNGIVEEGIALRLFNPDTRLWSIHWASSNTGALEEPVVGSFDGGVGIFLGTDSFEGKPILVKFCWDATDPLRPVWSQAFSEDEGQHWEWNWYMYFTKVERTPEIGYPIYPTTKIGVIELRNYRMRVGARDSFISYFEEHLLSPQAEMGGYPLGGYRVKGEEDQFCWIRGFENISYRSGFLPGFYGGTIWAQHREAANSHLSNNDEVYLLRPVAVKDGDLKTLSYLPASALLPHGGIVVADLIIANTKRAALQVLWAQHYLPILEQSGLKEYSLWVSEETPNDFPRLPAFQDPNLLVQFSFYDSELQYMETQQKAVNGLAREVQLQMQDTITLKRTWILYPTEKSLSC